MVFVGKISMDSFGVGSGRHFPSSLRVDLLTQFLVQAAWAAKNTLIHLRQVEITDLVIANNGNYDIARNI